MIFTNLRRFRPGKAVARRLAAAAILAIAVPSARAAPQPPSPWVEAAKALTYQDLVDLAQAAPVVALVDVRKAVALKPGEGGTPRPGTARLYVEARTRTLLVGEALGESVRYLVEMPVTGPKAKPVMPRGPAIVFASTVKGRRGELRLVAPDAQVAWTPGLEARVRSVLTELVDPAAAPRVTGLREVIHVPGNLAGEGETQIFVRTVKDPIAVSVLRRPGQAVRWGVSLGDVIDPAAQRPEAGTLLWYRLACSLPRTIPPESDLSDAPADRAIAAEDYAKVLGDLGPCTRSRKG